MSKRKELFPLPLLGHAVGMAAQLGPLTLGRLCGLTGQILDGRVVLLLAPTIQTWCFLAQPLSHHLHMHVESVPCDSVVQGKAAQLNLLPALETLGDSTGVMLVKTKNLLRVKYFSTAAGE